MSKEPKAYAGPIEKGQQARLKEGTPVIYIRPNGTAAKNLVQWETTIWTIAEADYWHVAVGIGPYGISTDVFRANLLELLAPDGSRLWPVHQFDGDKPMGTYEETIRLKGEPEPVLTLKWLREHIPEVLEWLVRTVPHTNPAAPSLAPRVYSSVIHVAELDQWPLPDVIAALRKAEKWHWLNWLRERSPALGIAIATAELKEPEPDYPADRVKELEGELEVVREAARALEVSAGNSRAHHEHELATARRDLKTVEAEWNEAEKELATAREEIECLDQQCSWSIENTQTFKELVAKQDKELARRDRLEAAMGDIILGESNSLQNIHNAAEGDLVLAETHAMRFGTPEARAKFEGGKG